MKVTLTDAQRKRFEDAAYECYNAVGPEADWDRKTPSKATFVCVISDLICQNGNIDPPLTREERDLWLSLPDAARRRIVLAVGP